MVKVTSHRKALQARKQRFLLMSDRVHPPCIQSLIDWHLTSVKLFGFSFFSQKLEVRSYCGEGKKEKKKKNHNKPNFSLSWLSNKDTVLFPVFLLASSHHLFATFLIFAYFLNPQLCRPQFMRKSHFSF